MAEIVLEGITKRYPDGAVAVRDVDLTVADGEFVILVGPSGCGKSTTLNMIAGLEDITEGTLRIGGRVVNDKPPKDRDIAMVFQSYALYPHMSVRENMGFALRLAKTDGAVIREKVEEAARILDLTEHLDRKPANLSGGQRQRVAMGRAIVRNPKAFLMDEPLSNLDAKLRVQMRTQISRLQQRLGTTTVYVTHDQTEAMTLGDRVVVMRGGVVQQVGTPQHLYEQPRNLFVAGFIGSPAMNFLHAVVEGGLLRTAVGEVPLDAETRRRLERAGAPRDLIVGLRPEAFEDAALVDPDLPGARFTATVDVVESLGSDVYAHFTEEGWEPASSEDLAELAADSGASEAGGGGHRITTRLGTATRVREGGRAELYVDTSGMHVFDPRSGANLALRETAGDGR
ncbi:sn-glycerol-3-phosphate ABC transporter ATP-binding protein UgpC [Streptomyces sp. MRC013]|uniref:ABC transporter ATP-binding protein n=1 Tax=Streptomyces sp. MRC013 TaxID=2898276 RepID=UPI00202692F4|nr:sn-glycerol-3-phosphate ABC transporter ATP-binding protein UgpC [Streptomyces sp. MRC013]URM92337.1 sn-glycerol-3-phosphate ABC transporter ATP-binding protein UgpC [Streptomyces sp. MRC013]